MKKLEMKKLEIALDSDGLLSNFIAGLLVIVEEVTGRRFDQADVTSHDFAKALGLSAHEERAIKKIISTRRGFVMSLPTYPLARQGVRRLRDLGDVFCVTHPWEDNPWWRDERSSWLALHFGIDRVHYADDNDKTKYEADLFVDDRAVHVREWLTAWPGKTAVFWRTPHNASEAVPWGAHSISSWDALYQIARQVALGPVQRSLPAMEESTP